MRSSRAGLAFERFVGAEDVSVWVADADGSHERRLAANAYGPVLSPDGRWVTYYVPAKGDKGQSILYVGSVAGGRPLRVGAYFIGDWLPDSSKLAVSNEKHLLLVDPTSGERRRLADGDFYGVSFAPDGKALTVARTNDKVGHEYRSDVFVIDLSRRKITQLTHDGHSDSPVWGREWIAYRRFHFNYEWSIGRVRLMRPDGSGDRELARGDERTSRAQMGLDTLEFSENGRHLLACAAAEFGCPPVLFSVPAGQEFKLRVPELLRIHELATAANLSRDGDEVLVDVAPFDGGNGRVYSVSAGGGKPRLLVRDATSPTWAQRGRPVR